MPLRNILEAIQELEATTSKGYDAATPVGRRPVLQRSLTTGVGPRYVPVASASQPAPRVRAFEVTGTNAPRRHTVNFDNNPLQVQARRRSMLLPQESFGPPTPSRSQSAPVVPLMPQPAAAVLRNSRYTPSPLSKSATFPVLEEEGESPTAEEDGFVLLQDRNRMSASMPLSRRSSARSLRRPTKQRPLSTTSLPLNSQPFHLSRHASTSTSRPPRSQTHEDLAPAVSASMTLSQSAPSTSRDPNENWLTTTTAPRFSRAALPSVVMPLPATPKNRSALGGSRSSSASSLQLQHASDGDLPAPRRPGSTHSSTGSSLHSKSSWDSLNSSEIGMSEPRTSGSTSVSPTSSTEHGPSLPTPNLSAHPTSKICKLKRAWVRLFSRPSSKTL